MTLSVCAIGDLAVERGRPELPLTIVAGPCALEDEGTNRLIASTLADLCGSLGLPLVFKGSFDKANRSSVGSPRGPAMESGLAMLAAIRSELGVPVTTDVHEPGQAAAAAEAVDLLQVPAFLCRQTDLLRACAETGRPVNVKKGQFLSPAEMRHVITKLGESGCEQVMLTERGTFFGYHRLVNDFVGLGDLMELGPPVCFDVTHSTQLPGGEASTSGGRPERAELLARAATAAGVDALFIECHPDPARALSDPATVQPLDAMPKLLGTVAAIRRSLADAAAPAAGP
jgi:2-dehydro-3-deoxyphosphooctonate aldolase (KDO 8-P synthase)